MNFKILIFSFAFSCVAIGASSQHLAVKNNLLYSGLAVPNLGLEMALGKHFSADFSGAYNPFKLSDDKQLDFWYVQPEIKYWFMQKYAGSYIGFHTFGGKYDIGGVSGKLDFAGLSCVDLSGMKDYRYDGKMLGAGMSFGHYWILSPHWGIEASLGVGYAHLKYNCGESDSKLGLFISDYFGPTKAGINLVYLIK